MNDSPSQDASTRTYIDDADPLIAESHGDEAARDHRLGALSENYRALIRERAIYYPVSYQFERLLGEGRQGKVFVGLRHGARGCLTRHAIKVFDPSIYKNREQYWTDMGRIASQVSVLQTLRSPFLANIDSYDEVNGIGYVQMEIINGADLREILSCEYHEGVKALSSPEEWEVFNSAIFRHEEGGTTLQPGIAVYIMRMILKGLESLHSAGFIHSDIKPSNIMIDRFGYIKLIDYGRAVKPREKTNILFGSPLYMAPELHRREPGVEQSDLYSVGIVGLEMLLGHPPISMKGKDEEDLLRQKEALPERLSELLPEHVRVNEELMSVLRHFIEVDPNRRFSDARVAETEEQGLRMVHKQLMQTGMDADYARMMGTYMARLALARSSRQS